MRNYDFHQLLSPEEFAHLATDMIEIKEDVTLRVTPKGKDGGVDFHDETYTIIGQVKNYKDDFNQLKSALKQELSKVRRLKPKRYLLITATTCSDKRKKELVEMFEGYLKECDILDKEDLNRLLSKDAYHRLEISYLNLLIPNITVLLHSLDKVLHKDIYTQTEIELKKIKKEYSLFASTNVFFEALTRLQEQKIIIISGEPGVGKSMLGRRLCSYFINQEEDIQFVKVSSVEELYEIYDADIKQIYFFDDFWGEIEFDFQITPETERKLIDFINYIIESDNKWLVITTREYILNEGLIKNNKTAKDYLSHRFRFELTGLTKKDKFDILYHHLCKTELSFHQMHDLLESWQLIIEHKNYSPRLVEMYLLDQKHPKNMESSEFCSNFIKFLDSPYSYWEEVLEKLSFENILFLILLSLEENEVKLSYMQQRMYEILKDHTYSFKDNIKILEDSFILVTKKEETLEIKLKNPSYRDFLLTYFGRNYLQYLPKLLSLQLSTSQICLLLESILKENSNDCKDSYYEQLENRFLNKLDSLEEYNIDFKTYILSKVAKCINFKYFSKISIYILDFIKERYDNVDELFSEYVENYYLFPHLIDQVQLSYSLEKYAETFINAYIENIYSMEMFLAFLDWKKIYPTIFDRYLKINKDKVQDSLNLAVSNDVEFYAEVEDGESLDGLIIDMENVKMEIGMSCSKELMEEVDNLSKGINWSWESYDTDEKTENESSEVSLTKEEKQKIQNQMTELVGENQGLIYNEIKKRIENSEYSEIQRKRLQRVFKQFYGITNSLLYAKTSFDLMASYLEKHPVSVKERVFYDKFVDYLVVQSHMTKEEFQDVQILALHLLNENKILFTIEDCAQLFDIDFNPHILSSLFFVKRGEWYHFIHPYIQYYLVLRIYPKCQFLLSIDQLVIVLYNNVNEWRTLDYYNISSTDVEQLISQISPDLWNYFSKILLKEFIKEIDTTSPLIIATSILKFFDMQFHYEDYGGTTGNYKNPIFYDVIEQRFNIDLAFYFDQYEFSDEIGKYIEAQGECFNVNEHLSKKKFQKLLISSGVVKELNELYHHIRKFIEPNENKVVDDVRF